MYNRQDMLDFRLYAVFYFTPVLSRSKCETAATLQKTCKDHHDRQRIWICSIQVDYRILGSPHLLCRPVCLMAERSDWKYKQTHQGIYSKAGELWWFYRQKNSNDIEENKQKAKTKTQFSNTKMRVLQRNIIILHLLVDSTISCQRTNRYVVKLEMRVLRERMFGTRFEPLFGHGAKKGKGSVEGLTKC